MNKEFINAYKLHIFNHFTNTLYTAYGLLSSISTLKETKPIHYFKKEKHQNAKFAI